jgi:CHAT domain-containing protein/tetratricopeptide (TPR) repeat protein
MKQPGRAHDAQRTTLRCLLACTASLLLACAPAAAQSLAQTPPQRPASSATDEDPVALLGQVAALHQAGKSREAIGLAERALQIAERRYGADDPATITIVNALGSLHYAAGDYARAAQWHQRALTAVEQAVGAEHPMALSVANNLANAQQALGQLAPAQALLERVLAAREKLLGADHPDTATSLNNLASVRLAQGYAQEALPLLQRALKIREKTVGAEHADTASVVNNLGAVYDALGQHGQALAHFERAAAMRTKLFGPQHPLVATSLHNAASALREQGRLEAARTQYERALAIREATLGTDHPDTATTLNNLAELQHALANYDAAIALQRRALAARERTLGPDHPQTATSLNNLASLLEAQGQLHDAEDLYDRALTIQRQAFGLHHPNTASTLNNLAALYESMGEYGAALPYYEAALEIVEAALGPQHPATALSLNNLSEFLRAAGDWERALPLQQRALQIREQALGPTHPTTATSVNNLAALYAARGRIDDALPLAQRALAINERALGARHPDTARAVSNLASLYRTAGRTADALELDQRALRVREQALGPTHLDVAISANNLGTAYATAGRKREARAQLQRALAIVSTLGQPTAVATVAANLGAFYRDAGDAAAAAFYLKLAVNAAQSIRAGARALDRELQRALARRHERPYRALAELLIAQGRLAEAEQVLQMLKEEEQFEFTRRDGTADPRATRAALSPAEQQLADGFARSAQELSGVLARIAALDRIAERTAAEQKERDNLADRHALLSNQWSELIDAADRRLREQGRNARARVLADAADTSGAQRALLARIAAASGNRPAIVYVLPSENATTFLVTTPEGSFSLHGGVGEAALNTQIAELRKTIAARSADYTKPAGALYQALIAPIEPRLSDARIETLMFYLVDGLRYLPLAALIDPANGKHLIEKYALTLYTAAAHADLARPPSTAWTVAALGASKGGRGLSPLPGVVTELAAIVRESKTAAGTARSGVVPGERFLDQDFTLERLLGLMSGSGRYAVLHLATHFELVPGAEELSFLLLGDGDALSLRQIRRNGALRPSAFDLVTLSACETAIGLGAASGTEVESLGVVLQQSGAQAVIATLWKIQDVGTAALMRAFYEARGESRRMSKAQALRAAQLALLSGRVSSGDAKIDLRHPYFWAPFVLMGNWL